MLEAADGAEGIALARRHLPDVVLSDVMMPGTDGHELVRALRESAETDFLSIILLTAQAEDEQRIAGLERGADDYMVKPFEMRELDVRVRNLIASRRRLRERFSRPPSDVRAAQAGVAPADQAYVARVRDAIHAASPIPISAWASWRTRWRRTAPTCSAASSSSSANRRRASFARMRVEEGERLLMRRVGDGDRRGVCGGIQQPVALLPPVPGGLRRVARDLSEPSGDPERLRNRQA